MRELYRRTFSQVHSSTVIRWEDYEMMKPKKKISRNLLMLAAVVALLAVLSTVAVAADLFGLRELLLPKQQVTMPMDPETGEREVKTVDVIGLSGYLDSPESRALAEWQDFLNGYDVAGAAQAADANHVQMDERHSLYQVYNQEMADKLDGIVEQYGLKLHSARAFLLPEEWEIVLGDFLLENNTAYSGYLYGDGTCAYDGDAELPGYGLVDYQFRWVVRGTFDDVILNIDDVSRYQEWAYETACGVPVTLALGPVKGLLIADLGDSFVTVNVLAGTETDPDDVFSSGPISAADLETLADSFDFTVLTPVRDPGLVGTEGPEPQTPEAPQETAADALYLQTGIDTADAEEFVENLVTLLQSGDREAVAELFAYPCQAWVSTGTFTVESAEEFLLYYDEIVENQIEPLLGVLQSGELFGHNGMVGAGSGAVWFGRMAADGELRLMALQGPTWGYRLPNSGVMAEYATEEDAADPLYVQTGIDTAAAAALPS